MSTELLQQWLNKTDHITIIKMLPKLCSVFTDKNNFNFKNLTAGSNRFLIKGEECVSWMTFSLAFIPKLNNLCKKTTLQNFKKCQGYIS